MSSRRRSSAVASGRRATRCLRRPRRRARPNRTRTPGRRRAPSISSKLPRRPGREGARLVEDVVGGELLLRHDPEHGAPVHHGRGVVEVAAVRHRDAQHEHLRQRRGLGGEAQQLAPLRRDEAAPLNEVLRGVSADDLLGERDHRGALRGGLAREPDAAVGVGAHGPHGGVRAGERDLDQPHGRETVHQPVGGRPGLSARGAAASTSPTRAASAG
jgi:hypothetical protein